MIYIYFIGGIVVFISVSMFLDHHRMRGIARSRGKPNICGYARSFDFRSTDTRVMREVYSSIQEWVGKYDGFSFPVQSDDSFDSLYRMHPDDLDEIYFEVADKLGISTNSAEKNPYFERVDTVKDLVLFLCNQPKLKDA